MMDRRAFVAGIGALLTAPLAGAAQPRDKIPRIAVLDPGRPPGGRCVPAFQQGLRDLAYIEGQTLIVDLRFAEDDTDRLFELAAEVIGSTPDVLWTHSPHGARAAQQATKAIPIVIGVAGYLVEQRFAVSLGRPGGNMTGLELGDIELNGKRLELLRETLPTITRVALLVDPTMRAYDGVPRNVDAEARSLGMRLHRVEARGVEAFEGAFAAMVRGRAEAVVLADVPLFVRNGHRLFALALRHRLPTIAGTRKFAEDGGLIAYGANVADVCRRSATYVDKILKGAKPGELPVERPNSFELVINLKTAKALGLTIPPSLLLRADQVIE